MRYLQDEIRCSACPHFEGLRVYEFDIVRNVSFVNQFASEPFVIDVFNRLKVSSELHAQPDRVSRLKKPFECLAVTNPLLVRVSLACRGRDCHQRQKECAFQMPVCPQEHGVVYSIRYASAD